MTEQGFPATFRATGQTGIMIAGGGIPMDAVVSDFIAGAAECLSPNAAEAHWDIIEGQGSLFHPAYAAVTLGLLHGSQPDDCLARKSHSAQSNPLRLPPGGKMACKSAPLNVARAGSSICPSSACIEATVSPR